MNNIQEEEEEEEGRFVTKKTRLRIHYTTNVDSGFQVLGSVFSKGWLSSSKLRLNEREGGVRKSGEPRSKNVIKLDG